MSELKLGWLSPDGELVECNSYDHIAVAGVIIEQFHYVKPVYYRIPDDDFIIEKGWVHIGISELSHRYVIWWKTLTELQKIVLRDYFENKEFIDGLTYMRWEQYNELRN